ncbi:MAG: hypothetical protein ABI220_05245 [Candidatus Saccharimonadales bacterium]
MSWQEIVLAVGQVVFILALLPSILTKDKPEIWTSILTGTVALSISITYSTLSLKAAAISAFFNFVAWGILAFQKLHQIKAQKLKKAARSGAN